MGIGLVASGCGAAPVVAHGHPGASGSNPSYAVSGTWKDVGPTPHFSAVDTKTGEVLVTNLSAGTITALSSSGQVTGTFHTGGTVHTVMVDQATDTAYVTDIQRGYLDVLDLATGKVSAEIPVASHLHGLAVSNRLHEAVVTDVSTNKAYVIDTLTNKVVTPAGIPVGPNPWGVAIAPRSGLAYVTNTGIDPFAASPGAQKNPAGDSVSVVNLQTDKVIRTVVVGPHPWNAVVDRSGDVYVGVAGANKVAVLDGAKVVKDIPVPAGPHGIAYDPRSGLVFVNDSLANQTSVISTDSKSVIQEVTVGAQPQGISVNPLSGAVYVANQKSQTVSVLAPSHP